MLVLAMSSAKPESLNTTRVSTAGASSLTQATIPALSGSSYVLGQPVGKADDQRATADGMNGLACNGFRLDRDAEIEAELEQQLIEHVLLLATLHKMFCASSEGYLRDWQHRIPKREYSMIASLKTRKPASPENIGLARFTDVEARRIRSLSEIRNGSRSLVVSFRTLPIPLRAVEPDKSAESLIGRVLTQNSMRKGSRPGKEIQA